MANHILLLWMAAFPLMGSPGPATMSLPVLSRQQCVIILFASGHPHASNACMTQSVTHLEKLISFNTVSRDSNLALIDHVSALLEPLGFRILLAPSEDGRKANLYASVGPEDVPGVVLSGHTDVVPVDGQAWSAVPCVMRRDKGLL